MKILDSKLSHNEISAALKDARENYLPVTIRTAEFVIENSVVTGLWTAGGGFVQTDHIEFEIYNSTGFYVRGGAYMHRYTYQSADIVSGRMTLTIGDR